MKMRCRRCRYYNYDFLSDVYEAGSFCGLHGRAYIDPFSEQVNLNHNGGCGFSPKNKPIQLELF